MSASDAGKVCMAVIDYVPEGFDIVAYAEERYDVNHALIIVWEIGGGKKHWHIVGTVRKHKQGHAPDWIIDHPVRTGHGQTATRPIRTCKSTHVCAGRVTSWRAHLTRLQPSPYNACRTMLAVAGTNVHILHTFAGAFLHTCLHGITGRLRL